MKIPIAPGLLLAISAPLLGAAQTTEPPRFGMLYNTRESHSMKYECDALDDANITCKFTQIMVRKALDELEAQKHTATVIAQYRDSSSKGTLQKGMAEICKLGDEYQRFLNGGATTQEAAELDLANPINRRDLEGVRKSIAAICADPSEKNFIALDKQFQSKKLRTCKVATNDFSQNFQRVGNTNTWTAKNSKPEGNCGFIQLSRFEEVSAGGVVKFWVYRAKRATTNPNGKYEGFLSKPKSCSEFDESEYLYDWKERSLAMGCDYVEFDAF